MSSIYSCGCYFHNNETLATTTFVLIVKVTMQQVFQNDRDFMTRFIGHHEMSNYYRLHPGKPLVEGEYDGTKLSFESNIVSLVGTARLREYGLLNMLPFFVRNLAEVLEETELCDIAEINIAHYGSKLIRMRNENGNKDLLEVLHFDIGDMFEYFSKETYKSKLNHTDVFVKRTGLSAIPYHPLGRFVFLGIAFGITALVAETIRAWNHSYDSRTSSFFWGLFNENHSRTSSNST